METPSPQPSPLPSPPACPHCNCVYVYEDGPLWVCPECAQEWPVNPIAKDSDAIRDSVGNILVDGDTVTVIKNLKVKGASMPLKVGTKVKNIRLVEGDHDIDCKIEGFGAMKLKSIFVKKA